MVAARDSTALLAKLSHEDAPDALVSDWMISASEQGPEAIARVRERYPRLPAVLATADSAPGRREQARALGLPLLLKPVQPAKLRAALNALLATASG